RSGRMALARLRGRHRGADDVEVRRVRARDAGRLVTTVTGDVARGAELDREAADRRLGEEAGAADLPHVHPVRRERLVDVVRVGVGELRLAGRADAQLEEVAERPVAALAAEDGLDAAAVDRMLARELRRRELDRRGMAVRG